MSSNPSTRCSGCSVRFQLMPNDGRRCGGCKRRSANQPAWPQCTYCGNAYEFLPEEGICGDCAEYVAENGVSQLAQGAVAEPANPRTHSQRRDHPADTEDEDDDEVNPRRARAKVITGAMATSHATAVARAAPGVRVAPPKFKGVAPPSNPGPKPPKKAISLRIDRLCNIGNGKKFGAGPPHFIPQNFEFRVNVLMTDVRKKLVELADTEYTKAFGVRIYDQSGLAFVWTAHKSEIQPHFFEEKVTIGEFWEDVSSRELFVKPAQKKACQLDWTVLVKYDPSNEDDDEFKVPAVPIAKRARSTTLETSTGGGSAVSAKKSRISASGSSAYRTTIPTDAVGVQHTVDKYAWTWGEKGSILWTKITTGMSVIVENDHFGMGKTKHAFKMIIGDKVFAAKCFFNLGRSLQFDVSKRDNLQELKNELARQLVAARTVAKFMKLGVDDAFILIVTDGPQQGHAWIVDPLYENASLATCKFSGTDQAGDNSETLVGRTCDTLAHYSHFDSEGTLVFVDIEGIDTASLSGLRSKSLGCRLVLFDLMVHSIDRSYGLGDKGKRGIDNFANQHHCNAICVKFGLEPLPRMHDEVLDEDDPLQKSVGAHTTNPGQQEPEIEHKNTLNTPPA